MLMIRHAIEAHPELSRKEMFTPEGLDEALYHGADTACPAESHDRGGDHCGLLPILWGTGAGSEVMSRIAAPIYWWDDHGSAAVPVDYSCRLQINLAAQT